jgi:mannose-6-phosphate isomerase-like protein (cupin superfamily)
VINIENFEKFIYKESVYQENIIYVIDDFGRQILLENLGQLQKNFKKTIKVELMEKFNFEIYEFCESLKQKYKHNGPVTCHAFRAFEHSKSFPEHIDPDDVFLLVIFGEKKILMNGQSIVLKEGDTLFIPANTKHQAINEKESLMLSFGLEKFLTDKIH